MIRLAQSIINPGFATNLSGTIFAKTLIPYNSILLFNSIHLLLQIPYPFPLEDQMAVFLLEWHLEWDQVKAFNLTSQRIHRGHNFHSTYRFPIDKFYHFHSLCKLRSSNWCPLSFHTLTQDNSSFFQFPTITTGKW